jgi:hypothetical protein
MRQTRKEFNAKPQRSEGAKQIPKEFYPQPMPRRSSHCYAPAQVSKEQKILYMFISVN